MMIGWIIGFVCGLVQLAMAVYIRYHDWALLQKIAKAIVTKVRIPSNTVKTALRISLSNGLVARLIQLAGRPL